MSALIEGYRVSPQQKRLWQLQREGLPRRSQLTLALEGAVNAPALEAAVRETIGRHESLRTGFHRAPGVPTPIQVINDSARVEWRTLDLTALEAAAQTSRLAELFDEEESRATVEEESPAVSATFVALGEGGGALHVSLPSLCADAWTFANLTREMAEAYEARLEGRRASEEVVQYLQFSEWQNELLEDDNAAVGYAFWRGQNVWEEPTTLPFARRTERGAARAVPSTVSLNLPGAARLEDLAHASGVGVDSLMLACWQ